MSDDDAIEPESDNETKADDRWKMPRLEVLAHALRIAKSYRARGLSLTLRQLYYRFVAEAIAPSGQKVYNKIGSTLTNARYDGTFPIDLLEDRGRDVGHGNSTRFTDEEHLETLCEQGRNVIKGIPDYLVRRDRWYGQKTYVNVWVEKQALEGVFNGPCLDLGVGLFALKGYPSVSALYEFAREARSIVSGRAFERHYSFGSGADWTAFHQGTAERVVVLYFGDHDPDGWQIPRSAEDGIRKIQETYDLPFPLEFRRLALNMDQIEQFRPPPFEAKMTSARYRSYRDEHDTDEAWELDALDPSVLQQIIRDEVGSYFDEDIHQRNRTEVLGLRAQLRRMIEDTDTDTDTDTDGEE